MFSGKTFFVLPSGMGKGRKKVLETQAEKHGAKLCQSICSQTFPIPLANRAPNSYLIIVEDDLTPEQLRITLLPNSKKGDFLGENSLAPWKIVRAKWLSSCLKQKDIQDISASLVQLVSEPKAEEDAIETTSIYQSQTFGKKRKHDSVSPKRDSVYAEPPMDMPETKKSKGKFVCETSSADSATKQEIHNAHITEKLQILADAYKSTNDKWRTLSYEKAIQAIKHFPRKITSREEVLELKGIGNRLADKIWEICQSGELRKADEMSSNEKVQTMNVLTNIWGVGPTIAEQWYVQGIRTLEDVKNRAKLSHQQKIGLAHYEDLLKRMPREEASEIVDLVVSAANEILPELICQACGSYRRGKETCGDVDILLTHKDGHSHEGVLGVLVNKLTDSGFLTDHLVECHEDGNQKKYMGVCRLPGNNRLHRRIDIIAIPHKEYATSLIYFTGSAHFTRSIYAKAKSMGMRLNQHGLRGGIMRQAGEKLNDGYPIDTPTEQSVFEALAVPYRTPAERDHP